MSTDFQAFQKFAQFAKVDEAAHETYSISTCEVPDKDDEICVYLEQVPYYKKWSDEAFSATSSAGQGISFGNMRWQHSLEIAGKVTAIDYKEQDKEIWIKTQPIPEKWPLIKDGFVTGVSQAGSYVKRWCATCGSTIARGNDCPKCNKHVYVKYVAAISEVSYVDNPCLGAAHFAYVKADGSIELRKFQLPAPAAPVAPDLPSWPIAISPDGPPLEIDLNVVSPKAYKAYLASFRRKR